MARVGETRYGFGGDKIEFGRGSFRIVFGWVVGEGRLFVGRNSIVVIF